MVAAERETVITVSDADDVVSIWTAQRPVILRLARDDRFTLTASGEHDGSPWASFTVPADRWSPLSGAKRRMSDTEREARRATLAAVRASKSPVAFTDLSAYASTRGQSASGGRRPQNACQSRATA